MKQVEIALVDQRDADVCFRQRFAGMNAGKASADDHDMGLMPQAFLRWLQLQKEMGTGHG